MARKKKEQEPKQNRGGMTGHIENAGLVIKQPIVDTLRQNYMPYAMSVIVSRAIPEIDGFKPSHRKLLYTMYKMGLQSGGKIKSANVVGQTMRLNPHGDAAIYETMVRLSRGYGALIVPYVDSKGNFGRAYSRDMAYAASRYTEVKLEKICTQIFSDIEKDTVDFADNYDNTMKEPTLLPVTFPTILVNSNTGIAVGMASNICSFNLAEVCESAIARLKNPKADLFETLKAPDFSGGGYILYDETELRRIYETGRGSVKVRCKYRYDKSNNCIDVTEIPPTTTVEAIVDKIVDLVKAGKIREISDIRDETDLSGLKMTMDLKRGADPEKLMARLFKSTPLEDSFACNFNVLVHGYPKVMGVGELLDEWSSFRRQCVRRGIQYDLNKKKEKLHLLQGLEKILMDIDKAIRIVRGTEEEKDVVPNLMIGFGIDEVQAEFVAEIKLRHLNREYILERTDEIDDLLHDIEEMEGILSNPKRVDALMIAQLKEIIKNYGEPRRSEILYLSEEEEPEPEEEVNDYPVRLFLTKEGYFKKITPQSWRMSSEHKLKEGDEIRQEIEAGNASELLFFTNLGQVYKSRASDFDDTKASVLGDYIPTKLGMDSGEAPIYLAVTGNYQGSMLFAFENGKAARVDMASYETKTRRKKLLAAFSVKSPLVFLDQFTEERDYLFTASGNRNLIVSSAMISQKTARDTQGVQVISLKKNAKLVQVSRYEGGMAAEHRLRTKNIPAPGGIVRETGEQLSLKETE